MRNLRLFVSLFLSTIPSTIALPPVPLAALGHNREEHSTIKHETTATENLHEPVHNVMKDVEASPLFPRANIGRATPVECPDVPPVVFTGHDYLKSPEDLGPDGLNTAPLDLATHKIEYEQIWRDIYKLHCDTLTIRQAVLDFQPTQGLTWATVDRKMVLPSVLNFDTTCRLGIMDLNKGSDDKKPTSSTRRAFISYGHERALIDAMTATLMTSIPDTIQAMVDKKAVFEGAGWYREQGNDLLIDSMTTMMLAWDEFTSALISRSYQRDVTLNNDASIVIFGVHDKIKKAIKSIR